MRRSIADCRGNPLITFTQWGRVNNNMIELVKMIHYASLINATLVVPAFMHETLAHFDTTLLFETPAYCIKNSSSIPPRVIEGSTAYFLKHSPDASSTKALFQALVPRKPLRHAIRCAISALAMGKERASATCDGNEKTYGSSIRFRAVQVRHHINYKTNTSECGIRASSDTRWCNMKASFVHQHDTMRTPRCASLPMFMATDREIDETHLQRTLNATVLESYSTHILTPTNDAVGKGTLSIWTDIMMLALAECVMLNPTSTFSFTVDALRAYNRFTRSWNARINYDARISFEPTREAIHVPLVK